MEPTRSSSGSQARRYGVLGLVLLAFGAGAAKVARRAPPPAFRGPTSEAATPLPPATAGAVPGLRGEFVSQRKLVHTHAASLVELSGGKIRAFWYAGTDEGTQDVTIETAVFDPRAGQWTPERTVASRATTQDALFRYVKKVGNPVAARGADGSLWLFYVTVSLGGWGGSSITEMHSRDDGETWTTARRMITSPFFNLSTLVKGPPIAYTDGTMGLPVHHEFIGKFGELLQLDANGAVLDKARLSAGRAGLQPVVLVEDARRALVLMRYTGKTRPNRVLTTATDDGGRTWSAPVKSALANSDAALTGLVLPDGRMLVALNNSEDNRNTLSLVISSDGGASWKTIYAVEDKSGAEWQGLDDAHYAAAVETLARATDGASAGFAESVQRQMHSAKGWTFEFSYPSLLRTSGGEFHLVYTWNEAFIKHVQFSQAWLDARSK
jgi:predicted neuraminidase